MKDLLKLAMAGILVIGVVSCNDNDDYEQIQEVNKVATDSVKIENDTMQVYSTQSIVSYSNYTTECEGFYAYDYQHDNLNRLVTTYKFKTNGNCGNSVAYGTKINFQPQQSGNYVFKFWQGKDASDNDIWLEKTIVVE